MTEQLTNTVENKVEKKSYKKYVIVGILSTLAIIGAWRLNQNSSESNKETPVAEEPAKCASSWEMPGLSHPDGNYIEGGVDKIVNVDNKIDPKNIVKDDWLDQIAKDKVLLEHAGEKISEYGENKIIDIDPNSLVDSQGCATEVAKTTVKNIEENIEESRVNYAQTPWYFANSFFNTEKNEIQYSRVTSENKSARITFKNARILDILGICGNIAEPRLKPVIKTEYEDKDEKSDKDDKHNKKKNTPKSSDSSDYKQPGDGTEKDSGTGTKPKATETSSADTSAPTVEKSTDSSDKPDEGGSNSGTVTD